MAEEVSKSVFGSEKPVLQYCIAHSTPLSPLQNDLTKETLKQPMSVMLGAPEVLQLNAALMKSLNAKKVLDIGVFTGASSLNAALNLAPSDDAIVIACDVSEEYTKVARKFWKDAGVENRVKLVLQPATITLQGLLDNGEAGTFDFAFVDADKENYDAYYELCLKLLRPGGIIGFDNTLWSGKVLDKEPKDASTKALKALNEKIRDDNRVQAVLMNVGDGYTLVTKKHQ